MDFLANLGLGFGVALTPANLGFALVGCLVGTLVGVLPGIGPVATVAMLLPLTFHLEPVSGLIMLAGIFYGAQYGGSTTAILVNMPGETSSVVTCIDGHQMARNGRAGAALTVAALGSFFAGTRGDLDDRAVLAAAGAGRAVVRRAGVFLADGGRPDRRGGAGARLDRQGGGDGAARPAARPGRHRRPDRRAALHVRHHHSVRRHRFRAAGDRDFRARRGDRQPGHAAAAPRTGEQQDLQPLADQGGVQAGMAGVGARHADRLDPRRAAGRRRHAVRVRRLCAGEEDRARSVAVRQGRDRRRRRAGIRQQRRRADLVHSDADARHSRQRGDGADDRRADHPRHPARPAGDDRTARRCSGA